MTDQHEQDSVLKPLSGPSAVAHSAVLALAIGYTIMAAVHSPPLAAMTEGSLLASPERSQLLISLTLWTIVVAVLAAAALRWTRKRGKWPATLGELAAALWPLTLLPIAWYAFDIEVWSASPVLLYAVCIVACGYCVVRTQWPPGHGATAIPAVLLRFGPAATLAIAIATYVVYVSIHTIGNHYSLGTAAFDLGIHENTLWNTVHGDFFFSSLEGGSHLGVHTSFIMLAMVPFYALAPATETILIIQALVLGLAAWPLYLLASRVLANRGHALTMAVLWLAHPAVGGANFYDFHAIAFAPLALFSAAYFRHAERQRAFWISIAVLLSIKEEMAVIVVLLGLVSLISGRRAQGFSLIAVGAAAYVVLQNLVIPHFAGGEHSYTWYYTDMIPRGEGPLGLLTTALLNPIFSLKHTLTQPKILFVLQLFAPLALLSFFTLRGAILVSYGLAATLLASRPSLYQIGFQYTLTLLAMGFVAALLGLQRLRPDWRLRALVAAVLLAVVTCFHYGMIWPRHHFTGGFHTIDFDFSDEDRERYQELQRLIEQIPEGATILASENLVPHVANRHTVETERYARKRKPMLYDALLVHNDDSPQRLRELPYLGGLFPYELVERTRHFVLFVKRGAVSKTEGG